MWLQESQLVDSCSELCFERLQQHNCGWDDQQYQECGKAQSETQRHSDRHRVHRQRGGFKHQWQKSRHSGERCE